MTKQTVMSDQPSQLPLKNSNTNMHRGPNMVTVKEEIKRFAQKHLARLENHVKTSRYQLTCHKEKTEEDNTFGPCVIVM